MTTEISLFILQTEVVMMVKLKTFNTPGHCEKVNNPKPSQTGEIVSFIWVKFVQRRDHTSLYKQEKHAEPTTTATKKFRNINEN